MIDVTPAGRARQGARPTGARSLFPETEPTTRSSAHRRQTHRPWTSVVLRTAGVLHPSPRCRGRRPLGRPLQPLLRVLSVLGLAWAPRRRSRDGTPAPSPPSPHRPSPLRPERPDSGLPLDSPAHDAERGRRRPREPAGARTAPRSLITGRPSATHPPHQGGCPWGRPRGGRSIGATSTPPLETLPAARSTPSVDSAGNGRRCTSRGPRTCPAAAGPGRHVVPSDWTMPVSRDRRRIPRPP